MPEVHGNPGYVTGKHNSQESSNNAQRLSHNAPGATCGARVSIHTPDKHKKFVHSLSFTFTGLFLPFFVPNYSLSSAHLTASLFTLSTCYTRIFSETRISFSVIRWISLIQSHVPTKNSMALFFKEL